MMMPDGYGSRRAFLRHPALLVGPAGGGRRWVSFGKQTWVISRKRRSLRVNPLPDLLAQSLQFENTRPGTRLVMRPQNLTQFRHQSELFRSAKGFDASQDI